MIFVTGGTGFLGRHLLSELCRADITVRVLTRSPQEHPWLKHYKNVEVILGDLRDKSTFEDAVQGCSSVIHAGGYFRFWGDEHDFIETNRLGTENLVAAAMKTQVQRFIYISTIAVIGQPDPENIVDETHPPQPVDPYQRSKFQAESLVLKLHEEQALPAIILRPGAYYGPLGEYAFNRLFFRDPMRGIIMQINGGKYITFPAYIGDVVQGIVRALDVGRPGEIYHICGDWISHKDAFDIVCQEANLYWPRPPIPGWLGIAASRVLEAISTITHREPFWPINMKSYVYNYWRVSNEKAKRDLGFRPIDFREGARRTIQWYRDGKPDDIPEVRC